MSIVKKAESGIRHLFVFLKLTRLSNLFASAGIIILNFLFRKGIRKDIAGVGKVYVCHECWNSTIPGIHEVKWWEKLIQETKEGDTIVDVGAYVGIFTIILAKKAGKSGKVLAFEPNPKNSALFNKNVKLNGVSGQVEFFDIAISEDTKPLLLASDGPTSHIVAEAMPGYGNCLTVKSRPLDEILQGRKIDIMKIDTEGYEANILRGAKNLLKKKEDSPRFILIECHPYEWKALGASSKDIMAALQDAGYAIESPQPPESKKLDDLQCHWVIFASKHN